MVQVFKSTSDMIAQQQEIVYTESIYTDEDGFTFLNYNKYF